MRKTLFLVAILLQQIIACAQSYKFSDTAYYDRNYKRINDMKDAYYYRPPVIKEGTRYKVDYYYQSNNVLAMSGYYLAVEKDFKLILDYDEAIKHGQFASYDKAGNLWAIGEYQNDKQIGEWRFFKKDTMTKRAVFDEKGSSYVTDYSPSGHKVSEGRYEKIPATKYGTRRVGEWKWFFPESNQVEYSVMFKDNKRHGLYKVYDKQGNLLAEGKNAYDKKDGTWKFYSSNARLKSEIGYANNILHGTLKIYDSTTGNLILEGAYVRGYRTGKWKTYYADKGLLSGETDYHEDLGKTIYYDENGMVTLSGTLYKRGRVGKWIKYYPGTKNKAWVKNYIEGGVLNGEQIWMDTLGYITKKEEYVDGLKTGLCKSFYEYSDKLWLEYVSRNDTLNGYVKTYFRNGKTKRVAQCVNGVLQTDSCYNEAGELIACVPIYTQAKSRENIMSYIGSNLRYPEEARILREQGKVEIGFLVDESGKITDAEVIKSFRKDCDEEALRLIRNMPDWMPEMIDGKGLMSYQKTTVVFWLPEEKQD